MNELKSYSFEEALDISLGNVGTPLRNEYEEEVKQYTLGLMIREARKAKNLSQEELGRRLGVQKARISSIERGANITINMLERICNALGMTGNVNFGPYSVSLG